MSVLRNREDPYTHAGRIKTTKRYRGNFVLKAVGLCSQALFIGYVRSAPKK